MHSRKDSNRLLAATAETRRQVQSTKELSGMVSENGQRHRSNQKLDEIMRLSLQHSLAECSSFLEKFRCENGSVIKDFYSLCTFKPLLSPQS